MQLDEGGGDVATFFHYLSLAAQRLSPRSRLPVFTPEFLTSPGGFARLFLRALCAAARSPAVIVLDDYHEVRPDSPLHAALRDGVLELPDGVTAFVLSRSEPPAPLARLRANGLLEVFRGDGLALTRREAAQIRQPFGRSGVSVRCGMRNFQVGSLLRLTLIHIGRGEERKGLELLRKALDGAGSRDAGLPAALSRRHVGMLRPGAGAWDRTWIRRPDHPGASPGARPARAGRRAVAWELRVEALHGFAVRQVGKPPEAGRKAQKKPLEMLKLLVARGPGGMQPDALAERVWPEAEGDAARQSLKVTLHRVRRLLGSADAVTQREERVALNPERVFVDAWALARLLDRLEASRTGPGEREALRAHLQEYRGTDDPATEDEDPLLGALRLRLRGRLERVLVTRG
jgi:hypothetical protein